LRQPTILSINFGYLHEDYVAVQEYLEAAADNNLVPTAAQRPDDID
jgi:hypothetical protein